MNDTMKVCERCGKGTHMMISRSHSMVVSKRKQRPNLQRRLVAGRRLWLCTSCLSALTKTNGALPLPAS